MDDERVLSNKLKAFLTELLDESMHNIKKMKHKRMIVKILYYTITVLSIVVSAVLATIATVVAIPPIAIAVLSTTSGILTALSATFNFKNKRNKLDTEIEKCNKLKSRLKYVIKCNGDMSSDTYKQIMSEFT